MADDNFVPIERVARHFAVSISTCRKWVKQGKIPRNTFIKLGNTYRFNLPAVTAALVNPSEPAPLQGELELETDDDL
jgi:excisionase family DNA binding protein